MSWHRIKAILLQEYFIPKRSLEVIFDLFFTAVLSVLVFGFVAVYLARTAATPAPQYLLVGILLWEIIRVGQYSISVGAMWNVWSRNLSNLFIAPLSISEYLVTHVLSASLKAVVNLAVVAGLAALLFGFNLLVIGTANLALYFVNLLAFAVSSGIVILGLIFRFGTRIQALAWGLISLFQPLTAVIFPVNVLPRWLQYVAYAFPPTHVFEAARASLTDPAVQWGPTLIAFGLNGLYFLAGLWFFYAMYEKSKATGQFARNEQ